MWGKRLLYVGIGVAALIALGVGGIFWATSGVVAAGDVFLKHISQSRIAEAYRDLTAAALKATIAEADFVRTLTAMSLSRATSWTFTGRRAENVNGQKQGELQATVTLKNGGTVELKLRFTHEDGAWKLLECTTPFGHSGPPPPLPPDSVIRQTVLRTMSHFAAAIKSADFSEFHAQAARPLRIAKSAKDLKQAFSTFIAAKMDLTELHEDSLSFSPAPAIVDGNLHAAGNIRAGQQTYAFDLTYVLEENAWRLIGVNVRASVE